MAPHGVSSATGLWSIGVPPSQPSAVQGLPSSPGASIGASTVMGVPSALQALVLQSPDAASDGTSATFGTSTISPASLQPFVLQSPGVGSPGVSSMLATVTMLPAPSHTFCLQSPGEAGSTKV